MNAQTAIEAETLASAMAQAFGEIDTAIKGNENAAFKAGGKVSKYADINAVIGAIKPALINHGLFFTQHPKPSEKGVTVETVLHHANGEHLSLGELFVPANKQDAQGFGSALTYARRYALVTAFGVPVEDDDGNAASRMAAQGSSRDNSEARQVSPTGPATADQGRINEEQITRIQMLLRATKIDEVTFCQMMKAPEGAKLFQLPQARFAAAVEMLSTKLADMAKAETNQAAGFGEILNDEIPY